MEIWINPACSKCRTAIAEAEASGVTYTLRRYLADPPTAAELVEVLDRMGLEPWDIARPSEAKSAGITLPRHAAHRDAWIAAMVAEPSTIQRPIITSSDGTTTIARDPESLAAAIERG